MFAFVECVCVCRFGKFNFQPGFRNHQANLLAGGVKRPGQLQFWGVQTLTSLPQSPGKPQAAQGDPSLALRNDEGDGNGHRADSTPKIIG